VRGHRLAQSSFTDLLLLLSSLLSSFFLVIHSPVRFDHPSVLLCFVLGMCVACSTIIRIRTTCFEVAAATGQGLP